MPMYRIETRFRNRFGFRRADTRTIEAVEGEDLRHKMRAICDEIQARPGVEVSGGCSTRI